VLKISGLPRVSDSSSIAKQKLPSSVFDKRQLTTSRLNQSIDATKYMNPDGIGTYVISPTIEIAVFPEQLFLFLA